MSDEGIEGLKVRVGPWADVADGCAHVRREVFVKEQGVPESIEMDGKDSEAVHVLASVSGQVVGTGRLLADGKIGRMAVLKTYRQSGIGGAMLALLLEEARERGLGKVYLNAQVGALRFYEDFGFAAVGDEFVEADIRHRRMELTLA